MNRLRPTKRMINYKQKWLTCDNDDERSTDHVTDLQIFLIEIGEVQSIEGTDFDC